MIAIIVVALVALAFVLLSPSPVESTSAVDSDVTIRCHGSVSEGACARWGDAILAEGAPSATFEMQDLVRLEIARPMFGSTCEVEYFLQRYPDDAVWNDEIPCVEG